MVKSGRGVWRGSIPVFPRKREHYFDLKSVTLNSESLGKFDCVILGTNHDLFDYALIKKHASLIVDTRGVYQEDAPNVIRA